MHSGIGGEAGLRCGEMIGLEWGDVDLGKRQMCIQRSEWRGHVTVPKSGRLRLRADDRTTRVGPPGPPSSEESACALSGRWVTAHSGRRWQVCAQGRAASGHSGQRCPPAPTHVLLAFGDARRTGTSDSGAGRTSRPHDDAALHAPEPRSARRRDQTLGAWRHFRDGRTAIGSVAVVEKLDGGVDGTRTRGLRRDRPAF
jgi:hypothetical protein